MCQNAKIKVVLDPDIEDIIDGFLKNRYDELVRIPQYLDAGNFADIKVIGHKLKGNAGSYGLYELGDYGERLEACALTKDIQGIKSVLEKIKYYLDHLEITYSA